MAEILIVDDEDDIRHLFALELEDEGHQVRTARDGSETMTLLREKRPDLVILDIKLDQESGLELLKRISREYDNLPVILCSAFSSYQSDFSSWLADGYVVKSSNLDELKQTVQRILEPRV
ncbi:MAG: two-component system response regulator [Desulfuromonas sp.]|nr:MAG: two-component system response regulator [Desulfuromonas sp.]